MNERADRRFLEALLGSWIDETMSEGDRSLLLYIIGNDPYLDSWLEKKIDEQPSGLDPEVSRRMLERIHDKIEK